MSHKLQNYLRTYRKRAGLSQDEVAFLLGCESGAKTSRYERFARQPNLQTALAYRVIFAVSMEELFAGIFQRVERRTLRRVQLLAQKLSKAQPDRMTTRKLEVLRAVASGTAGEPVKYS
jgi:transcriptional regulator with XRE-family HTH domain